MGIYPRSVEYLRSALEDVVSDGDLVRIGIPDELDKRTNQYEPTEEGSELLLGELSWCFSKLVADDQARDIEALVE